MLMCETDVIGPCLKITIKLINWPIIADANVWKWRDRAVSKDYHQAH